MGGAPRGPAGGGSTDSPVEKMPSALRFNPGIRLACCWEQKRRTQMRGGDRGGPARLGPSVWRASISPSALPWPRDLSTACYRRTPSPRLTTDGHGWRSFEASPQPWQWLPILTWRKRASWGSSLSPAKSSLPPAPSGSLDTPHSLSAPGLPQELLSHLARLSLFPQARGPKALAAPPTSLAGSSDQHPSRRASLSCSLQSSLWTGMSPKDRGCLA